MAATLHSTVNILQQNHKTNYSPLKSTIPNNICFLTNRFKTKPLKCNAFLENFPKDLLENAVYLDRFPVVGSGLVQFQRVTEDFSEMQKWEFLAFAGLTWIYLTARPGVLIGAIDTYLLAPLQLGLDNLTGRRKSLKRSNFVIGDKLGEGSFGVVYSGVMVPNPKNVDVEEKVQKRGRGKTTKLDVKSKDKVILKKV